MVDNIDNNWRNDSSILKSVFVLARSRSLPVVDFTKSCKSKISRKREFQPIKSLEITLTITLTINLRPTTFCEIDPQHTPSPKPRMFNVYVESGKKKTLNWFDLVQTLLNFHLPLPCQRQFWI